MKSFAKIILSVAVCASLANADRIQHVFEQPKDNSEFNGVELDWDVDLTFTYQGLDQDAGVKVGQTTTTNPYDNTQSITTDTNTYDIKSGLALPTADLDIHAKIMKGFNVTLEVMLSSHHHHETYVKGGYATMDNLDWIAPGFAEGFMKNATIGVGVDDVNYGDYHFRRTDNADVFRNPFINNMGVEGYMAAGYVDLTYRLPSINSLFVLGVTNGEVNPDDVQAGDGKGSYGYFGKFAYDNQLSDDTRFRISQSVYTVSNTTKNRLYMGDKAGNVVRKAFDSEDFGIVWNALANYNDLTSTMTNVFYKCGNTEFFGLLEYADATKGVFSNNETDMEMLHYSAEVVQRFAGDKFYVAARYENAKVDEDGLSDDKELTQYQLAAGMFLSKTAMMKVEYFKQERDHIYGYEGDDLDIDGIMVSAALSF